MQDAGARTQAAGVQGLPARVVVGIIGTGAIGSEVARAAAAMPRVAEVLLYDIDEGASRRVAKAVPAARIMASAGALIDVAHVVVEAATAEAAREVVPPALRAGRQVLMMSIGALVDEAFLAAVHELAGQHATQLHLPSGAMAGIDGVRAASLGELKSVTLVTTKPPAALGIQVDRWTRVFAGSAREAIRRFPRNVNVAVCLALAGLGPDRTRVEVVADPLAQNNEHKLIVEGDFGRLRVELMNLPHPENPRTSYLASLSAIATLRRILEPVQLGA